MKTGILSKNNPVNQSRSSCKKKFLFYFKKGFDSQKYYDWERGYKWEAHVLWLEILIKKEYKRLLDEGEFMEIANRAAKIESKTNLLFSFEKMALRDAIRSEDGAKIFAEGLYKFVYSTGKLQKRFEEWTAAVASLPRNKHEYSPGHWLQCLVLLQIPLSIFS